MKKLMTMIAAVAMSFGLYADAFSTSFEPAEYTETDNKLVLDGTYWSGLTETSIPLTAYGEETPYGYDATGAKARRFTGGQDQYLKLATGTETLLRSVGAGNIFVDQLVKFTGFDDEPDFTADETTKIAVWMTAIEADEGVTAETNLYVSVGSREGKTKVQIPGEWLPETWYRLTIKSLGNIAKNGTRAGFIIYIDGVQVAATDATELFEGSSLTDEAAAYQAQGQLFPAMITTDADFAYVGFKGIGGIDDMFLDDQGPEFAQTATITVTVPAGVDAVVVDKKGVTNQLDDAGKCLIPTGAFKLVYTNKDGYMPLNKEIAHNTSDTMPIDDSDQVSTSLIIVQVSYDFGEYVPYDSADAALAAIESQAKGTYIMAEFKQAAVRENVYSFDAGTFITISDDYNSEEPEKAVSSFWDITSGNVTFLTGLTNNKKVTFTGAVEEVPTYTLTFAGTMKAGSQVIADALVAAAASITLDPTDCFVATVAGMADIFAPVEGYTLKTEVIEDEEDPANGLTKYYLAEVEYVASVTANGTEMGPFETVEEALAAVQAAEAAGQFPIWVKALADDGLTITFEGNTAKIAKGVTIGINKPDDQEVWVVDGELEYHGAIDGLVFADAIKVPPQGETIALGTNAMITVNYPTALHYGCFSAPTGYTVQGDYGTGTVQFRVVKICTLTLAAGTGTTLSLVEGEDEVYYGPTVELPAGTKVGIRVTLTDAAKYKNPTIKVDGEVFTGGPYEVEKDVTIESSATEIQFATLTIDDSDAGVQSLTATNAAGDVFNTGAKFDKDLAVKLYACYTLSETGAELDAEKSVLEVTMDADRTIKVVTKPLISPIDEAKEADVDGFNELPTPEAKAKATTNFGQLYNAVGGTKEATDAWVAKVYGQGGKIPAAKLALADAADIAISTTFDLKVMVEPTIDAPAVIAATEGPAAFSFAIKDGNDPVEIATLTANVKKLIKYAAALTGGTGFDYAKDTEVSIGLNGDKNAITAEFVAGPAAGFMKADFTTVDKE